MLQRLYRESFVGICTQKSRHRCVSTAKETSHAKAGCWVLYVVCDFVPFLIALWAANCDYSLSILTAIFQVNLIYWSKGWWRWWWQQLLDYWSYKLRKAPVKSSPPTNQHPVFLQAGCPSCCPTNSVKALKGKISHSMDLLTPSSPGGLPTLSLTIVITD